MKSAILSIFVIFSMSAMAAPAMSWHCKGDDITSELPVSFDLVLAEHDGSQYQYMSLDNFIYDGVYSESIDLKVKTVVCGKDDEGNDRIGQQYWDLQGDQFTLYSGCENESLQIEAICKPM